MGFRRTLHGQVVRNLTGNDIYYKHRKKSRNIYKVNIQLMY